MRRLLLLALCFSAAAIPAPSAGAPDDAKPAGGKQEEKKAKNEKDAKPSLEKLIELNGEEIFGCKVNVRGNRIQFSIQNPADFSRTFTGDGMGSPDDLKGINQRLLEKPEGGRIPNVAAIGRDTGSWTSRFDLADDFTIRFALKVPNIQRSSQLNVMVNHDGKSFIATTFFQNAALVLNGRAVKQAVTPHREFLGPPERWFDRKAGQVPVELTYSGGKFKVKLKDKEMVELEGTEKAAGGKVGFQFQKLAFVLSDFQANVKLDRKWWEDRLKELESSGKLKVKDNSAAANKAEGGKEGSGKKESARDREAEVDL